MKTKIPTRSLIDKVHNSLLHLWRKYDRKFNCQYKSELKKKAISEEKVRKNKK